MVQRRTVAVPASNENRTPHRPTIDSVAAAAGVSRQTVSNAINAPHRLRPETLTRVRAVIDQVDYRPNEAARSLRSRSSRLIGMRVSPVSNGTNVLDRFLHAMCQNARDRGYAVLAFAASSEDEEIAAYEDLLQRNAVDAFALTETFQGDPRVRWLLSHDADFVSFGRPWGMARPRHSWVDVDGAAGTRAAVDHLVEQGHRRIAFIGWPEGSGSGDDRFAGWVAATTAHRLARRDLVGRSEDGIAGGEEAAGALLDRRKPPTAFVCASDMLAVGALRAVAERGLKPGADVAITGFDDSLVAAAATPGLTSIRQPLEAAAATLVEVIVEHRNGIRTTPTKVLLPPALTVRPSSQR